MMEAYIQFQIKIKSNYKKDSKKHMNNNNIKINNSLHIYIKYLFIKKNLNIKINSSSLKILENICHFRK